MSMNAEELLSALIRLSRIDEYFDEFEFSYLLKLGRHLGIEDKTVESMIKHGSTLTLSIPKSEQERMVILYHMLFLMKIDQIITDQEKELVHFYGFKLGFSAEMVDDFISLLEEHKYDSIPKEKMLAVIKKYQN